VALRRKSRLLRALAALLLRLGRRLAAAGPAEPHVGDAATASSDAPAHWLARLRPGARRLSIRSTDAIAAPRTPPEPAPREVEAPPVTPLPTRPKPNDADWKVQVRERARELDVRPNRLADRERGNPPPTFGARSPPAAKARGRTQRLRAAEPLEPAAAPSPDTCVPPPPAARIVARAPFAREARNERAVVQTPGEQRDGNALLLRARPVVRELGTRPTPDVDTMATLVPRSPSPAVVPAAVVPFIPETRDRTPLPREASAPPQASDRAATIRSTSADRAIAARAREGFEARADVARHSEQLAVVSPMRRSQPAPSDEARWPSLPDEPGDSVPLPSGWPTPPRDASEWPSDETPHTRTADAAHEAFLRSEQKGERWNA
jgi:hypothetical protein